MRAGPQSTKIEHVNYERCAIIAGQIALPSEKASQQALATIGRTIAETTGLDLPISELSDGIAAGKTMGHTVRMAADTLGFGGETLALDAACAVIALRIKISLRIIAREPS